VLFAGRMPARLAQFSWPTLRPNGWNDGGWGLAYRQQPRHALPGTSSAGDLGRILLDVSGNRLGPCSLKFQCRVAAECFVSAPEGVLDLAVDSLFQNLRLVLSAGVVLFCSTFVEGTTVCLQISVPSGVAL
jgi:hypothetical protein